MLALLRIRKTVKFNRGIAQLVRVAAFEADGCVFKSHSLCILDYKEKYTMKQFYDWLNEKYGITLSDITSFSHKSECKHQIFIGYMIEFIHEKFNCKEIDIHAEKGKSMYETTYELLEKEINKRAQQ